MSGEVPFFLPLKFYIMNFKIQLSSLCEVQSFVLRKPNESNMKSRICCWPKKLYKRRFLKVNWNLWSDYIQESISSKISVSKNPFPLCPSSPLLLGCCRCVSRRAEMRRKWKVDVSIFLFYLELYNVDKAVSSRSLSFPSVSLNISSVLNNNNDLTLKRKNKYIPYILSEKYYPYFSPFPKSDENAYECEWILNSPTSTHSLLYILFFKKS